MRTLNYLGSKLRLLDFIEGNVLEVAARGSGVCDLFAGSGCVSYRLSQSFGVTSCDIQHYSKVICEALLGGCSISEAEAAQILHYAEGEGSRPLMNAFRPLIELEDDAIASRNLETLAAILEHGSVEVFVIEDSDSPLSAAQQEVVARLRADGLTGERSIISRHYGGIYFSYRQAVQIDALLEAVSRVSAPSGRSLLLAALLSTASDIADTVGKHFAQPIKARDSEGNIKPIVYNKAVRDKLAEVFPLYSEWLGRYRRLERSSRPYSALQGDYMDCLRSLGPEVKTIYADPPYTRDHYSRFYHVLETMTLRDTPQLSTTTIGGRTRISNGVYRADRHQSPFCIKSKAPGAFRQMFDYASATGRSLLLSYSPYDETKPTHPRVVTMQQLLDWAGERYELVRTVSAGEFRHNKLNSSAHLLDASDEAELLIVCTNPTKR